MTTNTNPRRNIDHSTCGHPLTKAARAICRRTHAAGNQGPVPLSVILPTQAIATPRADVPERDVHWNWLHGPRAEAFTPCSCGGKPEGFKDRGDGVWVCSKCDNPTRFYILNVLGGLLTA